MLSFLTEKNFKQAEFFAWVTISVVGDLAIKCQVWSTSTDVSRSLRVVSYIREIFIFTWEVVLKMEFTKILINQLLTNYCLNIHNVTKAQKSLYLAASCICNAKFHIILKRKIQEHILFPKTKLSYFHRFFLDEKQTHSPRGFWRQQ